MWVGNPPKKWVYWYATTTTLMLQLRSFGVFKIKQVSFSCHTITVDCSISILTSLSYYLSSEFPKELLLPVRNSNSRRFDHICQIKSILHTLQNGHDLSRAASITFAKSCPNCHPYKMDMIWTRLQNRFQIMSKLSPLQNGHDLD